MADKENYKKYQKAYYYANKKKINAQSKKYQQRHPRRIWAATIKYRYGITTEQYFEMLKDQNGGCAICGKIFDRALDIDHCHRTGKIRGLLCNNCNQAVGRFQDSIENLKKAITYLEKN